MCARNIIHLLYIFIPLTLICIFQESVRPQRRKARSYVTERASYVITKDITKEKYSANEPRDLRVLVHEKMGRDTILGDPRVYRRRRAALNCAEICASFISLFRPLSLQSVFRARIIIRTYHNSGILQIS